MDLHYDITLDTATVQNIYSKYNVWDFLVDDQILYNINRKHFDLSKTYDGFEKDGISLLDRKEHITHFFDYFILDKYKKHYNQKKNYLDYYYLSCYPDNKDRNYEIFLDYNNGYLVDCIIVITIYAKELFDNTLYDLLTIKDNKVQKNGNKYSVKVLLKALMQEMELDTFNGGGIFLFGAVQKPRAIYKIRTTFNHDILSLCKK